MKTIGAFLICLFTIYPLFSQQSLGLFTYEEASFEGYTLFAPNSYSHTYLIDNCGKLIHEWEASGPPGLAAYFLEDGRLLRTGRMPSNFNGGGSGGRLELYDWDSNLLWEYVYSSDTYHHHHDLEFMPNGNILLIAWESKTIDECIAAGRNPGTIPPGGLWSEKIVELKVLPDNQAEVVWEWKLWDHLVQDAYPELPNHGVVQTSPGKMNLNYYIGDPSITGLDWIHLNSVDYNEELDQVVVGSRHISEIWIIDHSTTTEEAATSQGGNSGKGGEILYRYGNPIVYKRGNEDDQMFFGQHNIQWIPGDYPGGGELIVFNNGQGRPEGNYSSVDVLKPPMDGSGNYIIDGLNPYGPEELSWSYFNINNPSDFFSANISGADRLPNGNTLICEGRGGHFFEVDSIGNIVWDYVNPISGTGPLNQMQQPVANDVFRTQRYALNYPGFDNVDSLDLVPGDPLEINPFDYECEVIIDSTYYMDPDTTIVDTTMTNLPPLQDELQLSVSPNPFQDFITIENLNNIGFQYRLSDINGRILKNGYSKSSMQIEGSDLGNGIYFLEFINELTGNRTVQKLIRTNHF